MVSLCKISKNFFVEISLAFIEKWLILTITELIIVKHSLRTLALNTQRYIIIISIEFNFYYRFIMF